MEISTVAFVFCMLDYTLPEEEMSILNLERRLAWRGDSLPEEE